MNSRILAVLLGLLVVGGGAAQVARSHGSDRDILRASVRDDALRKHDFRGVPRYTISVNLNAKLDAFTGDEQVTLTNLTGAPLSEVVFHLYPNATFLTGSGAPNLTVTEATVNGARASHKASGAQLNVALPAPLAAGRIATVGLKFTAQVPTILTVRADSPISMLRDLLRSMLKQETNYGIFAVGDGVTNLGHWFPMLAHHDGKNWDTVAPTGVGDIAHFDVAHYDVTIDAPSATKVVATGVEQTSTMRGERRVTHYFAGGVRDFAVQLSPRYEKVSRTVDGVIVNSYFVSEHKAAGARALDVAAKSLAFFNKSIGAYPYKELDIVEAPLASIVGGMEHPGLVTINQLLYDLGGLKVGKLGDPEIDQALAHFDGLSEHMLAFVIAHEVAHQWWNAVVGSDSKNHPFLDEALANHSARLALEAIAGKRVAEEQAFLNIELTYHLHRLMGGKDRAIDLPAKAHGGTAEYAAIVYGKGAMFFAALQEHLGKERFLRMLQSYYTKHQFGLASPGDLLAAARAVSPAPAHTTVMFRRWLDEARGDEDIGPIKLASAFEVLLEPMLGKGSPEANVIRELTKGFDGILRDVRLGKADLIDQLLGELDAALSGKPTKAESGVGSLLKALDELFKALDRAGKPPGEAT